MRPLILSLLLTASPAFAIDCDPNGRQPQTECFDGDLSNGEINAVKPKTCGVDARTGEPICDPTDICLEATGHTCRFASQAEAEAHYDAATTTVYQLWTALFGS
jgi:hypothetical protein